MNYDTRQPFTIYAVSSDRYPVPPFRWMPQPPPGLVSRMQPFPDHGETTYVGHGRLAGLRALITGGDSGIGRAVAIAYAREGADVTISYLPEEEEDAQSVRTLLEAEGRKIFTLPGNLCDEEFACSLPALAAEKMGGLDILVNNAGRQQFCTRLEDLTTEAFDETFRTNVYGTFWVTRSALPFLQRGASIINSSSVQAWHPSADLIDYAQTKAAILAFSKGLAQQLADRGIRVNAVAPGAYWTVLQLCGGQQQEKLEQFGGSSPLKRPGQPVEIAPLYVTLADPVNSYTTGQVWCSDGGKGTF